MDEEEILKRLKSQGSAEAVEGMARFGITPKETFGAPLPYMRGLAKEIGKNHQLAQKLWKMNIRETMIVASLIDDPEKVTDEQMEDWVLDLDYWEICDQVVSNLFSRTECAYRKAEEWSKREEEFVKRAGFVMMARLAVLHKKAPDTTFEGFLPAIERGSADERNNVKKAVSWALRQIGKRNTALNRKAIQVAKRIKKKDSKAARWIASDVL
ncbi:MAG: DNA alkylation repair protein, partial [Thermoplasmata archaeon]